MKYSHKYSLLILAGTIFALPAVSQDAPESLLPPGFDDPAPPPPEPTPETPDASNVAPPPVSQPRDNPPQPSLVPSRPEDSGPNNVKSTSNSEQNSAISEEDEPLRYIVPTAKRRSLGVVGVINESQGGFEQSIFKERDGEYLTRLMKSLKAPFISRWGTIVTRRLLMSKMAAPNGVDGADWVAERSWLLLRMGESVNARSLVQQVDARQYSNRLYKVAMPVFLANGDLAGFCPLADSAARKTDDNSWKMSRVICLSLSGEQSRATSLLNQGRRGQWATGVDYLLAEKAIGAGTNGRRAVKIEWEGVNGFNAWRHGLSIATGVKPPERFYNISGRHVRSWLVLAPMISVNDRIISSYAAAAAGTLSNMAMVDLFASADEDEDTNAQTRELTNLLNRAYTGGLEERILAMNALWDSRDNEFSRYSMRVLTARAAAQLTPSELENTDIDALVSSMMTAGLDIQAKKWLKFANVGTSAWAQIMVGTDIEEAITSSHIDDFYSQDNSVSGSKTSMLIAAAAGLNRFEGNVEEVSDQYDVDILKETRWSDSINKAVKRKDKGAVILLSVAGLQGNSWNKVPAFHVYNIVKALNAVGLNAEARMIAAEAIDRA